MFGYILEMYFFFARFARFLEMCGHEVISTNYCETISSNPLTKRKRKELFLLVIGQIF
jgi:hypothetical protein